MQVRSVVIIMVLSFVGLTEADDSDWLHKYQQILVNENKDPAETRAKLKDLAAGSPTYSGAEYENVKRWLLEAELFDRSKCTEESLKDRVGRIFASRQHSALVTYFVHYLGEQIRLCQASSWGGSTWIGAGDDLKISNNNSADSSSVIKFKLTTEEPKENNDKAEPPTSGEQSQKGEGACRGRKSCRGLGSGQGDFSCAGKKSCWGPESGSGAHSCGDDGACTGKKSGAGQSSCSGVGSCSATETGAGDNSCSESGSCSGSGSGRGQGSCSGVGSCSGSESGAGENSCTGVGSCSGRNSGNCPNSCSETGSCWKANSC